MNLIKPFRVKYSFILLLLISLFQNTIGQNLTFQHEMSLNSYMHDPRVDSIYNQMTPDQRIAQLFWLAIEVIDNPVRFNESLQLVSQYQPGGILYMKNSLPSIVGFTNQSKSKCRVPMLIAIDAEWGLGMRIDGVVNFPKAMTLGAIQDDQLVYEMGLNVAAQLRRTGIHVNLAPVADVNVNPNNPVIGNRSFGENPYQVARLSVAYMHGLQSGGVMAVAKHFPGHGDTDKDSHHVLPLVGHSYDRIDSVELVPFKALVKNGVLGVMTAHLEIPALDSIPGKPVSLSAPVIDGILRRKMGFDGLVITDAMNMQGVKKYGLQGRIEAMALMAGNDIIESTENIAKSIDEVKKAIEANELSWPGIELKCRKVLALKLMLQVKNDDHVDNTNLLNDLNIYSDRDLIGRLYRNAITKVCLPQKTVENESSCVIDGVISLGGANATDSISRLLKITPVRLGSANSGLIRSALENTNRIKHPVIVIAGNQLSRQIWNDKSFQQYLFAASRQKNITIVFCGSPYQLQKYQGLDNVSSFIFGYEENAFVYGAVARVLKGEKALGKLPVTINGFLRQGDGCE